MAAGHEQRHALEFGGSPVTTEFDGSLSVQLVDRIPIFTVSQDFSALTARQVRYGLVATWGPERPGYQRYQWVILDLRMVSGWEPGTPEFVARLRDRLRQLGGDLVLVAPEGGAPPGDYPVEATVEAAVEQVKRRRAEARAAALGRGRR
jgi:hypothetical protein